MGVTNSLVIHRSGYDGLNRTDPENYKDTKEYLEGMTDITNHLLKYQKYWKLEVAESENDRDAMKQRISLTIKAI